MAIAASGLYGLTIEKQLIDTVGLSIESETAMKGLLVTDSYTPAFDTHDFRDDITNEIGAGGNYSTGGVTLTTTEVTVGSPSAGVLKWDHDDPQWASSTIVSAMALIDYFARGGASSADEVYALLDFVTAVTTSNGLLLVSIASGGVLNLDFTP